jgi:hypothetical protein
MDGMRVSDADRERYAEVLRSAFAEGRLTDAELEERLRSAYAARTGADLEPLVADLPAAGLAPIRPASEPPSSSARRRLGQIVGWYFPALICTAIWALTSFGGYFWPAWVFFGLSIPAGFMVVAWLSGDDGEGD